MCGPHQTPWLLYSYAHICWSDGGLEGHSHAKNLLTLPWQNPQIPNLTLTLSSAALDFPASTVALSLSNLPPLTGKVPFLGWGFTPSSRRRRRRFSSTCLIRIPTASPQNLLLRPPLLTQMKILPSRCRWRQIEPARRLSRGQKMYVNLLGNFFNVV